jgi:predicted DNA-binding transcriptional regulator AlpA
MALACAMAPVKSHSSCPRHGAARPTLSVESGRSRILPELLTPGEVAAWLQTTVQAVYSKAERGTLPGATHIGRRLYFLRAELLGLVEQGRVPYLGGPGGGT